MGIFFHDIIAQKGQESGLTDGKTHIKEEHHFK